MFWPCICSAVHRCTLSRAVCCPLRETVTDTSISMITGFPLPHKPWWPCTAGGPRRSSTPNWYSTLTPEHKHHSIVLQSLCTERTEMCPDKYCTRLCITVILPWLRAAFTPEKTPCHTWPAVVDYICVYTFILTVSINKSYVKLHGCNTLHLVQCYFSICIIINVLLSVLLIF